jgi:hypothetical protein
MHISPDKLRDCILLGCIELKVHLGFIVNNLEQHEWQKSGHFKSMSDVEFVWLAPGDLLL